MRSLVGYTRAMELEIRRQRCEIFVAYLRSLRADFRLLCRALTVLMAESRHDRRDLSSVLMHSRIQFGLGLLTIQFRLVLYRWGWACVDGTSLVKMVDAIRFEVQTLIPSGESGLA